MKDAIGDRMKRYESPWKSVLPWRLPVVVRVDGKSFHSWTIGCQRPYDQALSDAMNRAAVRLCQNMQGAKIAYVQSDEISVLLYPWSSYDSDPWFGNEVQKITSVSAAIASASLTLDSSAIHGAPRAAFFDSRVMVMPEYEVVNMFIWRQQDAVRNSLQSLAQSLYSQKQLHGKKRDELHELCFAKGHNWNDLPVEQKRGRCVLRQDGEWVVDRSPPTFSEQRDYIAKHLEVVR